ncbi:hypothetical protein B0H14DRAFT_2732961 [Mycena olivaceomarginata]|nr:hypothetical protein B0H14DRAFT_2732961 [Mycena olivaceomarginata]
MVYTIVVHLYAKEGAEIEEQIRTKLAEASRVYASYKETISWLGMQDHKDPRAWCIIERYEHESSTKEHTKNPYFKMFFPLMSLLARPMEMHRFYELDTSKPTKSQL